MKIKPLSILGIRRLPVIPEYFQVHTKYVDDSTYDSYHIRNIEREIAQWIEDSLHGRYAINYIILGGRAKILVGFEDPLEYTYFQLGGPHL